VSASLNIEGTCPLVPKGYTAGTNELHRPTQDILVKLGIGTYASNQVYYQSTKMEINRSICYCCSRVELLTCYECLCDGDENDGDMIASSDHVTSSVTCQQSAIRRVWSSAVAAAVRQTTEMHVGRWPCDD